MENVEGADREDLFQQIDNTQQQQLLIVGLVT